MICRWREQISSAARPYRRGHLVRSVSSSLGLVGGATGALGGAGAEAVAELAGDVLQ